MSELIVDVINPITKLNKDLKSAAKLMTNQEARFLVDLYYSIQANRISSSAQMREAQKAGEPNEVLAWAFGNFETTEKGIKSALNSFVSSSEVGQWLLSIHGIGPVISAGLIAHIDIYKAPTVGHIWSFAGLDPNQKWEKGKRRPWNASLKVLCWKAGQSFMKLRSYDNDIYGSVYEERKQYEIDRNERGGNATVAADILSNKSFKDNATKKTLESGKLPKGQLDARARRYAVKLFLSHLHHVMHESILKSPPPKPYIISHGNHTHFLAPPNWPIVK